MTSEAPGHCSTAFKVAPSPCPRCKWSARTFLESILNARATNQSSNLWCPHLHYSWCWHTILGGRLCMFYRTERVKPEKIDCWMHHNRLLCYWAGCCLRVSRALSGTVSLCEYSFRQPLARVFVRVRWSLLSIKHCMPVLQGSLTETLKVARPTLFVGVPRYVPCVCKFNRYEVREIVGCWANARVSWLSLGVTT